MTISFVQVATNDSSTNVGSLAITLSLPILSSNALVIAIAGVGLITAPTFTITDNLGNTYFGSAANGGNWRKENFGLAVELFFGVITNGGSCTVTVTPSSSSVLSVAVMEYSGVGNVNSADNNSGTGTSLSVTNTLSSFSNLLVVSFAGTSGNASTITGTGGAWTERANIGSLLGVNNLEVQDQTAGSTPSNPTWTVGFSSPWAAISGSFGSPPIPPPPDRIAVRANAGFIFGSRDLFLSDHSWLQSGRQSHFTSEFIPSPPFRKQSSQDIVLLPDFWQEWEGYTTRQPQPISYIPTPPSTHQQSQVVVLLPDFWQEWEAFRQVPFAEEFIPSLPKFFQPSQRIDESPDTNFVWWEQFTKQPIPVGFVPDSPPSCQSSQRWDDLPDTNFVWWEQFTKQPIPSGILVSQEGVYGIYNSIILASQDGVYRIRNAIEGYNVYIGRGVLPDLTQPPTVFSAGFPISIPITPPGVGLLTLYVLVQKQDAYDLVSNNQSYSTFTIDSSGNLIIPGLLAPQNLTLFVQQGGLIQVIATYPGSGVDKYPADQWYIWVGTVIPNPATVPTYSTPVSGRVLSIQLGPFPPNAYYVMVALHRALDGNQSPAIYTSAVVEPSPTEVVAVFSGFDGA